MAYNSTIDKATDDVLIYGNTVKDGSGTSYVPLLDADGHQQVDVLSIVAGTGATNLGKAEDAAHTSGDVGIMPLAVRNDTPGTLANTSGDYTPLQVSASGALYTHDIVLDDVIGTVGAAAPSKVVVIGAEDASGNVQQPLLLNTNNDAQPATDIALLETTRPFMFNGTTWDRQRGDTTNGLDVDVTRSALPTGAATSAKQDTIIGHIDAVEATLDTIRTDTFTISTNVNELEASNAAIQTAVQLIDDTVFAEDVPATAADKGVAILAVRRDADTTLVGADNDYANLQVNANGALKVEAFSGETLPVSLASTTVTGTVAVTQSGTWDEVGINDSGNSITVDYATTGSGTSTGALRVELPTNGTGIVGLAAGTNGIGKLTANSGVDIGDVDVTTVGTITPGTAATSLGKAVDAIAGATDTGVSVLAIRDDALTTLTPADGDYAPLRVNSTGALHVTGGGGGTEYAVDTALGATPTGSLPLAIRDDALSALTPVEGDAVALRVDANGALWTALSTRLDSTNDSIATVGTIAHDAADSGNPVKIGYKVETSPKGITVPADGDRTDGYADADGMQFVKLNTSNADIISDATSNTDGASTASGVFTAVASTKNYVTAIHVFRTDSGTTPIYIDFRSGTGGSVLWRMVLPPNGGSVITAPTPLFSTAANTALAYDVSAATTTVYINVSGFQSKV